MTAVNPATINAIKAHVEQSIFDAERTKSQIDRLIFGVFGFSSLRMRHLLNNLASKYLDVYLELGTYKGSTLLSACYKNRITAFAIDHFKHDPFEPGKWNDQGWPGVKKVLVENLTKSRAGATSSITLLEEDAFTLNLSRINKPVKLCLYDGMRTAEDIKNFLVRYRPVFHQIFVLVIHNFADKNMQPGIIAGIEEGQYKTHYFKELKSVGFADNVKWYGGLGIFILEKVDVKEDA